MRAIPRIVTDFEEYPELRALMNNALQRVVELMELHGIAEIRRMHKTGVFDRPYVKDVVTPIGLSLPGTVQTSQYAVGQALLGYLESIGIQGISLELSKEDVASIAAIWAPPAPPASGADKPEGPASLDPQPVDTAEQPDQAQDKTPDHSDAPAKTNTKDTKENHNG